MKTKTAFTHIIGTRILDILAKLLMIGKSNQTGSSFEYERLRSAPKGTRRVDDIEF